MKKTLVPFFATALLLAMVSTAGALNYSFTGTFETDDEVQLFDFTVGEQSDNVILRSWSYAGGTNAAGEEIPDGGLDPILALFNSSGLLIDQNDDGYGHVPYDQTTGLDWDTYLKVDLAPGDYTVAVMQYDNFAAGPYLSDGFLQDGEGNFTGGWNGIAGGSFIDDAGNQRTNAWAFDILNVQEAAMVDPETPTNESPEPATIFLLACGVIGLAGFRKKIKK